MPAEPVFGGKHNGTPLAKVDRCAKADRLPFPPTASGSGNFTMKLLLVVVVPSGVVTVIVPDVAPAGTVILTLVAVALMMAASRARKLDVRWHLPGWSR